MPEPLYSPYVQNAQTIPRLLNRWLDVNAQNGALTRTRKWVTLPAFSVDTGYRGFGTIVGEFLFAAEKNFSLKINPDDFPPYPMYTLCVMWIESGEVKRYRIWDAIYPDILFDIPLYAGERIGSHFKFEIWSSATVTITQTEDVRFYTSVLGDVDYRYGVDSVLVLDNGLCTGQQSETDGSSSMPMPLRFGSCTYNYGPADGIVLLGNQIQQIITNENGEAIQLS